MHRNIALACGLLLPAMPVMAQQELRWINPAGGPFAQPTNWEFGEVPMFTPPSFPGGAIFDLDSTYTVTGGAINVDKLLVRAGDVTLVTGTINTSRVEIGTAAGPRTTMRLENGSLTFVVNGVTR